MILINQSGTFKYNRSFPLIKEDGTLLSTSYYTVTTDSTDYTCSWISKDLIQLTIPVEVEPEPVPGEEFIIPEFEVGDNVVLIINGVRQSNVIKEVSTDYKYRFKKIVSITTGTITIRKDYSVYEIGSDCPESYYRFKNGEMVLVQNRFMNMFISLSTLIFRNHRVGGLLDEAEIVGINQTALDSVYADLSYLKDVWNTLDVGVFKELLTLKCLSIIEQSHYNSEKVFNEAYNTFKKESINWLKQDITTTTTDVKKGVVSAWGWTLGS